MTQQEKDEFNKRHLDKMTKERKSKIICAAVLPVIAIVITILIGFAEKSKQGDIASAKVLDSMSVGEFLEDNENGTAIYTGQIRAVDPVSVKGIDGEYMMISVKIEQEQKYYDDEAEKYVTDTTTLRNDYDNCDEVEIDDVVASYSVFHSLPQNNKTHSEGANSNKRKTTVTSISRIVEGTFLLKCKNGEISSAEYYKSTDVAGESQKGFTIAKVLIWLLIAAIEIYMIVKLVSVSKAIKTFSRNNNL